MNTATSAPQPIGPIYIVLGNQALVPCSNPRTGETAVAVIDREDLELVKRYKWRCHSQGYARANVNGETLLLHRVVLGLPIGHHAQVDHRDQDKLNCCKGNLRTVTHQGNQENRSPVSGGGASKYRGVSWRTRSGKWLAKIKVSGRAIELGLYTDEREAALAAAKARQRYYAFNDADQAFIEYLTQELA